MSKNKLPAYVAAIVLLNAAMLPVNAQPLPRLQIGGVCRGIARQAGSAGEIGAPDLSVQQCVHSELQVRRQLKRLWPRFSAASRAECIGDTSSALSSYTDLLTCLQVAQEARRFGLQSRRR